jgi:TolB-like protein/DNA-binding winged helix-turn-helix (wHTH) protein
VDNNGKINLFSGFALDLARGCVTRSGEPVHLRPQTYEVLKYLAENRGHLISKDKLIEEVWKGRAVTDGSLGKCIEELREALGAEAREYIRNVRGRGYIFDTGREDREGAQAITAQSEQIDVVRVTVEDHEELPDVIVPKGLPRAIGLHRSVNKLKVAAIAAAGLLTVIAAFAGYRFVTNKTSDSAPIKSIAVLPLKNESGNPDAEYLSEGISESLINSLSQLPQLKVIARNSSFKYKGKEIDPREVARSLGVDGVLTGRVIQRDENLLISIEMVDARDNTHAWGEHYQRRFADLVRLQQEIALDVSQKLRVRLSGGDQQRVTKNYTKNSEAYQLYLRGRYHALKRRLPETQKAISYFQQAIAVDPSYALAYAGLADAHLSALAADLPSNEFLPQARAAAQKAIEIDDTLAAAHAELGFIIFWYNWDWGASENKFKRALELDAESADTHLFYAHLLSNTGRHEEALAEAKRARDLDRLNLRINALEGQFLIHAGRTDEALMRLRETLDMDANYFLARLYTSSAYIEKAMYANAVSEARKAIEISGARSTYAGGFLGFALAKAGKEAEARAVLEGLLKSAISPYSIALVYNGLGERDEALAWLERAYAQRVPGMVFLKVEPKWNNLRSHPRFQDLLRRVGFTS